MFPKSAWILLFFLSSPHSPNKIGLGPSCIWIKCTKVSYWYFNGPFKSDLVKTFKINTFNISYNIFILDQVISQFKIYNECFGNLCLIRFAVEFEFHSKDWWPFLNFLYCFKCLYLLKIYISWIIYGNIIQFFNEYISWINPKKKMISYLHWYFKLESEHVYFMN